MPMRLVAVLACTAAVASAQLQLSTTFANNNGGAVGGAVYFDLDAAGSVAISSIDLNFNSVAGTAGSVDVYVIPGGTWVGNTTNPALWTLVASSNPVVSNGPGVPTPVTFPGGLPPLAGPNGVTIVANGLANAYTNGTVNPSIFTGTGLTLSAGGASNIPFVGNPFTPRIVNVSINYIQLSTLSTTFANNNSGAIGGAVYFDLDAAGSVAISSIDLNFNSVAGTAGSVDVYVLPGGTWVGNTTNPALWSLVASNPVVSNGPGVPTPVTFPGGLPLVAGPNGITIVANGLANAYTNGTVNPTIFTGTGLTLSAGGASNVPFVGAPFTPRIVNININYSLLGGTPATNQSLGQGCYRVPGSFYELFAAGPTDLSNTCFTLTPSGNQYVVTQTAPGIQPVGPAAVVVPLTDDSSAAVGTLGLTIGSNGWVAFGPGNSTTFAPTVPIFLGNPSAAIYSWHDLNPAAVGSGQVFYEEPTATSAIITYDGVFDFLGTTAADANFIQIRIDFPNGPVAPWTIEIAFGQLSANGNVWLVGFGTDGASFDPGAIDLSAATPFTVPLDDIPPLTLTALTRPITGTNWDLAISNNTGLAQLVILGLTDPNIPDLALVGLGMPGCGLRASVDVITVGATSTVPIPANPTLIGTVLYTNGADLQPGVNAFGATTSNGVAGTIGDV